MLPLAPNLTKNVPTTEATMQTAQITSGYSIIVVAVSPTKNIAANNIVATTVTAYVSKRSAAIPAQSPTLSPTLSAIDAAFLGSSSGIPASTFPTISPPTSAPFVKIPPPNLANIEISDAPKLRATSASKICLSPEGVAESNTSSRKK